MTEYQEALENVKEVAKWQRNTYIRYGYICEEDIEALEELVEKATPKKPSFDKDWEDEETKDIYDEYGVINEIVCECPNCHKHGIYDSEYGVRFNHCHECGQALDWNE